MKWDELSAEQRDRLVHEKVMGHAAVCPGKLIASHVKVPSRAGGTAYSYWQIACDTCELVGYSDSEDNIPKEHPPKVDVPKYSTDMNAAWKIVEKLYEQFDMCIFMDAGYPYKYGITAYKREVNTSIKVGYGYSKTSASEAICLAALKVVGVEIE